MTRVSLAVAGLISLLVVNDTVRAQESMRKPFKVSVVEDITAPIAVGAGAPSLFMLATAKIRAPHWGKLQLIFPHYVSAVV